MLTFGPDFLNNFEECAIVSEQFDQFIHVGILVLLSLDIINE
jgi:hypothetical protein